MNLYLKKTLTNLFSKVESWILLFFLIRLIGIIAPPLETGHNWRQVTGLMVARNYVEIDDNILFPRVDDNNGKEGIIGMEFPSLNYLHFAVSKIFGYQHWYGRLINLIISSIGLLFFSKIISRFFNKKTALTSTLFLLCSIWFSFSRKMMPDTYCISIMFIGVYYGVNYLDKGKYLNILLYLLFTSLAILSKIPAGIYFSLLIPMVFSGFDKLRMILISTLTLVPIFLTFLWYFVWNPYLSKTYGIWYNSGKSLSVGFNEVISNLDLVSRNFTVNSFSSYIVFVIFLFGLFHVIYKRNRLLIFSISSVSIVFMIYVFKSGFFFYHHNYYIIPFVPIMALICGYGIVNINKKWLFFTLISLGLLEGILNQQHDFLIKDGVKYKMDLEIIADQVSSKNDLIAINGGKNPQQLYLTHRKGWTCSDSELNDKLFIKKIHKEGCRFIFVNKRGKTKTLNHKVVYDDNNYIVYDLKE